MFNKRKPLKDANNKNNKIKKLPKDIVKKISDYLTYSTAYQFAALSRHLFFTLNPATVLTKNPDYSNFLAAKLSKLEMVIENAVNGINNYLINEAVKPKVVPEGWNSGSVHYSKGYRRAICFKDILSDKNNDISVRAFALFVLLREANGISLKSKVEDKLVLKFGGNFLKMLESYVQHQFPSKKIEKMEKALLKTIHDDKQGPLPDRDDDYLKEDAGQGFTRSHLVRALEAVEEEKASCVLS